MRVSIDGGEPVFVDLCSEDWHFQQTVWSATALDPETAHTVSVGWTGLPGALCPIDLDAIDVTGVLVEASPPALPTARIDGADMRISYSGDWTQAGGAEHVGTTLETLDATGSASFAFFGTDADLIAPLGPSQGIMEVALDGGARTDVDLWDASWLWRRTVWSATSLAETTHTVDVYWTGRKLAASGGTGISLDAVDVTGEMGE